MFDVTSWEQTARLLAEAAREFESVSVIDVGGGLGVPERADQPERRSRAARYAAAGGTR
jgi:diaminopimelate decarboxylase